MSLCFFAPTNSVVNRAGNIPIARRGRQEKSALILLTPPRLAVFRARRGKSFAVMARLQDIPLIVRRIGLVELSRRVWNEIIDDHLFLFAATLAYSWLFAIFPF